MKKNSIKLAFIVAAAAIFLSGLTSCDHHTCPTYSQAKAPALPRA